MGLFDLFRSRPSTTERSQFPELCQALTKELAILREEMFLGSCLGLKREGVDIAENVARLEKGSRLSSALQAYQLTCIVGFALRYLNVEDLVPFKDTLTAYVNDGDPECLAGYIERYLDCEGKINLLSSCFAQDVYELLQRPTPRETVMHFIAANAVTFGIMTQAAAARLFGDVRTEGKLKARLRVG